MTTPNSQFQRYLTRFYFTIKKYIDNRYWILFVSLIVRSFAVLSPIGAVVRVSHQKLAKNKPLIVRDYNLFKYLDVEQSIKNINKYGYSPGIDLSEETLAKILKFCRNNAFLDYENPHEECETINKIAYNDTITSVARKYLLSEPKLWFTTMYWSLPGEKPRGNILYRNYPDYFHYDVLDFKALTLFIYLTDVDEYCAPHILIENTHNDKSLSKIAHPIINPDIAQRRYGNKIKVILGKKGTGFFEDTLAYHKRSEVCEKERLILRIGYTLLRGTRPKKAL